jgi:hypothetical protein
MDRGGYVWEYVLHYDYQFSGCLEQIYLHFTALSFPASEIVNSSSTAGSTT